jgi:uncharacterized protein (DUF1501 family)
MFPARAKRVIFMYMQGAPSQYETFDYAPGLAESSGKAKNLMAPAFPFTKSGFEGTLLLRGGEFGRTTAGQGNDGRNHNSRGYTMLAAGGGMKSGFRYGATDLCPARLSKAKCTCTICMPPCCTCSVSITPS